jgi:hypothetical protein
VWGDEDDDDTSIDSDNDDSGRLYDFVVAKTNDQEENVVARPGFTVRSFLRNPFLGIDFNFSHIGRWILRFLSINGLRLGSMLTIRACLRGCYMEKLCKVS